MGTWSPYRPETIWKSESILYRALSSNSLAWLQLNSGGQINFAGRPFYVIGILGFKVALCLAYLRIPSYGQRAYRYIVWSVLIACILGHVGGNLVLIFQCQPVSPRLSMCFVSTNTPKGSKVSAATHSWRMSCKRPDIRSPRGCDYRFRCSYLPSTYSSPLDTADQSPPKSSTEWYILVGIVYHGVFYLANGPNPSFGRRRELNAPRPVGNHWGERWGKESCIRSSLGIQSSSNEWTSKISLTCVPALGPLFTYFCEITSPHHSSSRRKTFDSSEIQSAEGITTQNPATTHTDPYLIATDSNPYSKFSRSQDPDSEMGTSSPLGPRYTAITARTWKLGGRIR